ncbi:MAG: hypothetical protein GSR86_04745 [Desulfurococcales archaeon]|nr:hypothetical protein [Desulfurococcales archaeon]
MDRDRVKREILSLIDDNYSNWRKAAFYSDPEVIVILDRLQSVWEDNDMQGYPIDYATDEELQVLLDKARRYAYMPEDSARGIVFSRQGGGGDESEGSSFSKFFRRIIGR